MAGSEQSGFRNLKVWQKAMDALEKIHAASIPFPSHEQFGLTSQLRRAAYSIPLNISEGYKRRKYRKDYLRFLRIAHGSEGEVETAIEIAVRLKYLDKVLGRELWKAYDEVGRMLAGMISRLEGND